MCANSQLIAGQVLGIQLTGQQCHLSWVHQQARQQPHPTREPSIQSVGPQCLSPAWQPFTRMTVSHHCSHKYLRPKLQMQLQTSLIRIIAEETALTPDSWLLRINANTLHSMNTLASTHRNKSLLSNPQNIAIDWEKVTVWLDAQILI